MPGQTNPTGLFILAAQATEEPNEPRLPRATGAAFFAETFRLALPATTFFATVAFLPTVDRVVFAFFEAMPLPPRRVRELRVLPGRAVGIIGLLGADLEHQVIPVDHLLVLAAPEYPLDL